MSFPSVEDYIYSDLVNLLLQNMEKIQRSKGSHSTRCSPARLSTNPAMVRHDRAIIDGLVSTKVRYDRESTPRYVAMCWTTSS
ncbi:hypothetical protein HZ326_26957 [Fusarium oxysporum f. sp. albedinis]|nr:hypothetical protein HZ326_26957 [Fusarium oxysporum f. sp. albedinis]